MSVRLPNRPNETFGLQPQVLSPSSTLTALSTSYPLCPTDCAYREPLSDVQSLLFARTLTHLFAFHSHLNPAPTSIDLSFRINTRLEARILDGALQGIH